MGSLAVTPLCSLRAASASQSGTNTQKPSLVSLTAPSAGISA